MRVLSKKDEMAAYGLIEAKLEEAGFVIEVRKASDGHMAYTVIDPEGKVRSGFHKRNGGIVNNKNEVLKKAIKVAHNIWARSMESITK